MKNISYMSVSPRFFSIPRLSTEDGLETDTDVRQSIDYASTASSSEDAWSFRVLLSIHNTPVFTLFTGQALSFRPHE